MGTPEMFKSFRRIVVSLVWIILSIWLIGFAILILAVGPNCGRGMHEVLTGEKNQGVEVNICVKD